MNKGRNKTEGKEKIRRPFHIKDFPHHHPLKTLFRASLELSFKVLPWLSTWEGRTPAGLPVYLAPISPTCSGSVFPGLNHWKAQHWPPTSMGYQHGVENKLPLIKQTVHILGKNY